ncbi:cellulase family glycosylhydrolase [Novosphingobium sp. Gsoil 351]|uniref:glycoside hydrolase family 5 protein n=1 Tax=Novosphingobium sp. Gsoil 351 TaxID=2675225 RepID=UPI0012B4AB2C|nr:cellulase family glycosylhydrolase [Novosphingobium sp. Gsoil 351]QGN55669.1 cellulase family glycosylhydrolase [Novosphingobium sp. Gsoil 351]
MSLQRVTQSGSLFLDASGAQMTLRGVNLGGDSKVPYPDGGTQFPSDFADHREVSFIGRPFPLAEADEHLARIARWGFNTLRLLTTWEAVEHAGPGLYDDVYLDYFAEVARLAGEHGLYLFVDFHQDVWSRMTGGDGAPGWIFESVGLDFTAFASAEAAHVMQARYDYTSTEKRQATYPQMSWGSNYRLPANGVMWTLFWAGRWVTPDFTIDGENVQDFLQGHYLGAMDAVAQRLAHMPHVLGFDTLNEPGLGWLAQPLSYRHLAASAANPERPRIGPALAPLDALALARGCAVSVPVLTRQEDGSAAPTDERVFNPDRVSIWRDGTTCPFEAAGVYRLEGGAPVALREDAFTARNGRNVKLDDDVFAPFYARVAETIRRRQPAWSVFAEMDAFAHAAGRLFPRELPERVVNASHWYDVRTLYLKRFEPRDGLEATAARFRDELGGIASAADAFPGGAPTLIGEFGIPYDLAGGADYARWAAGQRDSLWPQHEAALDLMYDAIDALGLHSTQWNYTASNRNDLRIGDNWNQEDLSIFSADQIDDARHPDAGGRALGGFCRPYAPRVQGRTALVSFDRDSGRFELRFTADASIAGATVIYAPRVQYPDGWVVRFEGVPAEIVRDDARQRIALRALSSGEAVLTLERPPADPL